MELHSSAFYLRSFFYIERTPIFYNLSIYVFALNYKWGRRCLMIALLMLTALKLESNSLMMRVSLDVIVGGVHFKSKMLLRGLVAIYLAETANLNAKF